MNRNLRTSVIALFAFALLSCAISCATDTTPAPVHTATHVIQPTPRTPTSNPSPSSATPKATANSPLPISPLPRPPEATHVNSPIEPPAPTTERQVDTPTYSFRIVDAFPHDPDAFTQGLVFDGDWLYEGTGLRGRSSLRRVELESGDVVQLRNLPAEFFGEGVTIFNDQIFQLTWQSNVGFVYDKDSFELLQEFHYPTEGWGLTHDGEHLILSDGTATLHFLDPGTLEELWQVQVFDENGPVVRLNELEFIEGEIYANVWQTDRIARIDPGSGKVTSWLDLTGLLQLDNPDRPVDVLNGIAYDAENSRLFVTGKWWPALYEIAVVKGNQE